MRNDADLPDLDWYLDNVLAFSEPGVGYTEPGAAARWQQWWSDQARDEDPIVRLAARQGFVLTGPDLSALHVTRSRARAAVARGTWTGAGFGAVSPVDVRRDSSAYQDRVLVDRRRHALSSCAAALRRG